MEDQREIAANAVALWAAHASPSPFNERHNEFSEYLDLVFAVEDEAEHWVDNAPVQYLDAAISLVPRPPDSNWNGWAAFNGLEDWDFYLEKFLGLWARRFPFQFGQSATTLLKNSTSCTLLLGAMADAASYLSFDATPFLTALRPLLEAPQELSTLDLLSLEEILNRAGSSHWANLWSKLSVLQRVAYEKELKKIALEADELHSSQ